MRHLKPWRDFNYKIKESTDWKNYVRLRELGLGENDFGFVIFETYDKSLQAQLGQTGWSKLLEAAKRHGVVRNSFKRHRQYKGLTRGDLTKETVFWESWIGPYVEMEKFKSIVNLLYRYSESNLHKALDARVQPVGEGLEDFITRWEWAIEHDIILLDDYVAK